MDQFIHGIQMFSRLSLALNAILSFLLFIPNVLLSKLYRNKQYHELNEFSDLSNQIIIITGSNTGIGKYTALNLLKHGCTIILACRDEAKAYQCIRDINNELSSSPHSPTANNGKMLFYQLDLSSMK